MSGLARWALLVLAMSMPVGCGISHAPNEILVQRFFGLCRAQYGALTDVSKAEGECGIITTLLNKFAAENPDIRVTVSTVPWPGYNQLSAQLTTGDPPDVVTMHESAISDFQSRQLLEPVGAGLREVGIDPSMFTPASVRGVTKNGEIYGLPFDTWAPLWHINLNYFRKAGLVDAAGKPILPHSPEEMLAQARQFKKATGKPYLVQALANQKPVYARNLFTYLMQQNAQVFPDPQHIKLHFGWQRRTSLGELRDVLPMWQRLELLALDDGLECG